MYHHLGSVERSTFAEMVDASTRIDLAPGPGASRITPIGSRWGGFASVVAVYPSAQLVAHKDAPIAGFRYHIPLDLNDGCWVFHEGTWQQLEVGHLYLMNPAQTHGAVNWGPTRRLHLILDRTTAWPSIV